MTQLSNDSKINIPTIIKICLDSYKDYPILGQLTACQAILEAGLARTPPSGLALRYNNLFGMKPGSIVREGTAGVILLDTKEYIKGKMVTVKQPFLRNKELEDSIDQHRKLFDSLSRYAGLKTCKTIEEACKEVYRAGYATDPNYPSKLLSIYNKYL